MTLAKVKEQDGIMLAKVIEQDGMMLAKVKEQDGMMLAKVKEQDGIIMLANVKVPSIPTSAACCDDVQLTKLMRNPLPTPLQPSFTSSDCVLQIQQPAAYLQLSTTSSDCVLLKTDTSIFIYNRQLLHRTASSFKPLM